MNDKKGLPSLPMPRSDEDLYRGLSPLYSTREVLDNVNNEIAKYEKDHGYKIDSNTLVQAMSLKEYENATLMSFGLSEITKPFALQLSLDLQAQYKCDTDGKKSLAELTALNYCRVLEVQKNLFGFLKINKYSELTIKIIAVLSKELDRAQRHYITSLQSLEMGLQPPLNISIRTNTANIAGQQAIQQVGEQTNVKGL